MSDIKKIKDEYISKLSDDLNLNHLLILKDILL